MDFDIAGWPSDELFEKYTSQFIPFVSRGCKEIIQIEAFLKCDEVIDVSVVSDGGEFSGDSSKLEKIELSLKKFVCAHIDAKREGRHWLQESGLRLYVAQVPVISNNPDNPPLLHACQGNLEIPSVLKGQTLEQVNLWMNIESVQSSFHYDGYHNILSVCKGSKKVSLISPAHTKNLSPVSAVISSPNHLSSAASPLIINTDPDSVTVTLFAGDSIFIPEGFWHYVDSAPCSMAINFWFESPIKKILKNNTALSSYLLRFAANTIVDEEVERHKHLLFATSNDLNSSNPSNTMSEMTDTEFEKWLIEYSRLISTSEDKDTDNSFTHNRGPIDNSTSPPPEERQGIRSGDVSQRLKHQLQFVGMGVMAMRRLWPIAAETHPELWTRVLLDLMPDPILLLTSTWDR